MLKICEDKKTTLLMAFTASNLAIPSFIHKKDHQDGLIRLPNQ